MIIGHSFCIVMIFYVRSCYCNQGYLPCINLSTDIARPWELHEDGKTEDVLKWSQECPKGNSCIHFLRIMMREARPYMMMRGMLPSSRRPHSDSAANRSPVSWPVWPILSWERSQSPGCKKKRFALTKNKKSVTKTICEMASLNYMFWNARLCKEL